MYEVVEYFRGVRHKVHLITDIYDDALALCSELSEQDDTAEYVVESYSYVSDDQGGNGFMHRVRRGD